MYYFKYNQQDATLYNILYYCQCSASVGELEQLTHASGRQQASLAHNRCCVYSFELFMMGGETARNM
jgi:hypothetical protein